MSVRQAIQSVDQLILLNHQKTKLLKELREALVLAELFGVKPGEIEKYGYEPANDFRWRFGGVHGLLHDDELYRDLREPNYVVLKDGRRLELVTTWQNPLDRKEYKSWRAGELKKYKEGLYLVRPDVSPAAWKRALKNQPATEIPQPKPTA